MKVLGFDPSLTNFGWAIHDSDESLGSPTRCLDRGRIQTSSKTLFVDRYCDIRQRVGDLVRNTGIRKLGVESPVFGELYSEGLYGLYLYTCEALRAEKCDVVYFSPGQIKAKARAFLTRPAGWKMQKPDMVEAAKTDCGFRGSWNHNEADAYWAAICGYRFWAFMEGTLAKTDLTATELKQFTEIHTYTKGQRAGEVVVRGLLYREDDRFFRWSLESENGA
jgi:Holliday junction resolvasome RuvABC endonuclease subunit